MSTPPQPDPRPASRWNWVTAAVSVGAMGLTALAIYSQSWRLTLIALAGAAAAVVTAAWNPAYRYFRVGCTTLGAAISIGVIPNLNLGVQWSPGRFGSLVIDAGSVVPGLLVLVTIVCFVLDYLQNRPHRGDSADPSARSGGPTVRLTQVGTNARDQIVAAGHAAGRDVVINNVDAATIDRIIDLARDKGQLQEQLRTTQEERDDLKRKLAAALQRAEREAEAGGPLADAAAAALEQARDEQNPAKLDGMLDALIESWPNDRREDPDYLELLRESAAVAYVRGEINKSADRLGTILRIAPNDRSAINEMGHVHHVRGRLDEAERAYRRVLELSADDPGAPGWQAAAYVNLGVIYQTRGDLEQAEAMQRKSLELNEKHGRLEGMAANYGNLGNIYETRGDLEQAEAMQRKALELNEKLGRLEGMAKAYGNLGVIFETGGDLGQAEAMQRKALELNEKLGRLEGMAINHQNLGNIAEQRGRLADARRHWERSRDLYAKLGNQPMAAKVQGWIDELSDKGR